MSLRRFSLLFSVALLVSIGAKAAATSGDPQPDFNATVDATRQMLTNAGFEAGVRHRARLPAIVVEAQAGDCRLLAGEYPADHTLADAYQALVRPDARLLYAYRGELHASAPRTRPLVDFFLWRELNRIGIGTARVPIVALILSPGCDAAALPWERVAFVSA
jgi:hypothetical protein